MPQFLFSVYSEDGAEEPSLTPEDLKRLYAQVDSFNEELRSSGAWEWAGGLMPAAMAKVVEAAPDGVKVTDGPFVEHLGGFWVVNAKNLAAAVALAEKASAACESRVEVRPFQEEADV